MKHKKKENCDCVYCKLGQEAADKMQKDAIDRFGWTAHYVVDDSDCPYGINAHTHNIYESLGHKDFQICFNIKPQLINTLFFNLANDVKNGKTYESGKKYDNVLTNYQVEFLDAKECGRDVLRLLIPDENGKYEGMFAEQLTKLQNRRPVVHNPN